MSAAALETPDRPEDGVDLWLCRLNAVRDEARPRRGLSRPDDRGGARPRDALPLRGRPPAPRRRPGAASHDAVATMARVRRQDWRFVPNAYAKPHLEAACAEAVPRLSFQPLAFERCRRARRRSGPAGRRRRRADLRSGRPHVASAGHCFACRRRRSPSSGWRYAVRGDASSSTGSPEGCLHQGPRGGPVALALRLLDSGSGPPGAITASPPREPAQVRARRLKLWPGPAGRPALAAVPAYPKLSTCASRAVPARDPVSRP